ncbi:uncharacterized protein PV09_06436 [Verruconis gallopava]|uniref:PH domain-containing protein n=1 Tax=Verruconis gallopava TaxID=253628 RepID=A0A0D1XIZ9_9PEZI|nr:uncharacterized protein PV09_06436 [Verruconis gallopava]KIW02286.1 hypothetical protein PV09_06436 [Verruconis gallopava]
MAAMADRRPTQPGDTSISASGKAQTWGYHNAFSTHATPAPDASPPCYEAAVARSPVAAACADGSETLPAYSCGVHFEGFLDMRTELSSPFLISLDNDWHRVHVELRGTQLHVHRIKRAMFRSRADKPGRLLRTYSLQHAEVGIAVDWVKGDLVPKATFARMLPRHAQHRLYETDPDLFEPVREFVFRLRVEEQQLLFCASTHVAMLDWVEQLCIAIDIAPPLDDRHEPRYRSLPRRTRRQRQIESAAQAGPDGPSRDELERRFIAEQESIFRRMYPNLAASRSDEHVRVDDDAPMTRTTTAVTASDRAETERDAGGPEPDNNEFDREDALGEPADGASSGQADSRARSDGDDGEDETGGYDPKTAPPRPPMSQGALCRFRRRCAPILLASSPRASHILFVNGGRYQIDARRCQLVPFVMRPPRYDAHAAPAAGQTPRPVLERGVTASSHWSSRSADVEPDYAAEASSVHSTNSAHDELRRVDTAASAVGQKLASMAKARAFLTAKMSVTPLRPLPRGLDGDIIAIAPVLV